MRLGRVSDFRQTWTIRAVCALLASIAISSALAVAAVFGCFTTSAAARADEPNPLDKLSLLWKSQQTEIASAHLKYRLSQVGTSDLAPLTPEQFEELAVSIGPVDDPHGWDKINRVVAQYCGTVPRLACGASPHAA